MVFELFWTMENERKLLDLFFLIVSCILRLLIPTR